MTTLDQVVLLPAPSYVPLAILGLISALTGMFLLLVFRYTSNQTGIKAAKELIKAHLLEIRLFKDDPFLVLRAQKCIILDIGRYLRLTLVPLAVMLVPIVLLVTYLDSLFGYSPLRPGETAVLGVRWAGTPPGDATIRLDVPEGLNVETPPVRIAGGKEVDWRIRAMEKGRYDVRMTVGQELFHKEVVVDDALAQVVPVRQRGSGIERLWSPGEGLLPKDSVFESITVGYQSRTFDIFGWNAHWLVMFFLGSLIAGYALQGLFHVKI
jgi:hypothetical protein